MTMDYVKKMLPIFLNKILATVFILMIFDVIVSRINSPLVNEIQNSLTPLIMPLFYIVVFSLLIAAEIRYSINFFRIKYKNTKRFLKIMNYPFNYLVSHLNETVVSLISRSSGFYFYLVFGKYLIGEISNENSNLLVFLAFSGIALPFFYMLIANQFEDINNFSEMKFSLKRKVIKKIKGEYKYYEIAVLTLIVITIPVVYLYLGVVKYDEIMGVVD